VRVVDAARSPVVGRDSQARPVELLHRCSELASRQPSRPGGVDEEVGARAPRPAVLGVATELDTLASRSQPLHTMSLAHLGPDLASPVQGGAGRTSPATPGSSSRGRPCPGRSARPAHPRRTAPPACARTGRGDPPRHPGAGGRERCATAATRRCGAGGIASPRRPRLEAPPPVTGSRPQPRRGHLPLRRHRGMSWRLCAPMSLGLTRQSTPHPRAAWWDVPARQARWTYPSVPGRTTPMIGEAL
jgi:hypothetical protein